MKRLAIALIIPLLMPLASSWAALEINDYDPAKHDRFSNDAAFIGAGEDWSGVGMTEAGRWGTLVSPSFIVSAAHFPPSGTIRFYQNNSASGGFIDRTIVQSATLQQSGLSNTSDLYISRLDAPATGVTNYSVLDLPSTDSYAGVEIFVVGKSNTTPVQTSVRVGRNVIDAFEPDFFDPSLNAGNSQNDVVLYDYNTTGGLGADEAKVVSGDSGAPSLAKTNDGLALVGLHWFRYDDISGGGSGDTFVPSFIAEMDAFMASSGSSERISRITAVPEPSAFVMMAMLGCASLARNRSRRRSCA